MFDNILNFFKKFVKDKKIDSKDTAKERLHLVLMQDRANVSADFLDLMKQEIIDVIKKYIDVDENSIDVKLTNKTNGDGTTGAPILYAKIPIVSIKDENKNKVISENKEKTTVKEVVENKEEVKEQKEQEVIEEVKKDEETLKEDVKQEENNNKDVNENNNEDIHENIEEPQEINEETTDKDETNTTNNEENEDSKN